MVVSTPQDYRLDSTVCLPAASVNALDLAHIVRITCTQGQSAPVPIHARVPRKLILPGGVERFNVSLRTMWSSTETLLQDVRDAMRTLRKSPGRPPPRIALDSPCS